MKLKCLPCNGQGFAITETGPSFCYSCDGEGEVNRVAPSYVGLPATSDEYLGVTLERVAFMKRGKAKKTSRCKCCGAKPAVTYEASFCDKHAITVDRWLHGEEWPK